MKTIVIEIKNPKTMVLLQELEDLDILKIVKKTFLKTPIKMSEKYKGVFSKEEADDFVKYTKNSRKEWDNT